MRGHVGAGRLQVHTGIGWHLSFSSESFEYYCIRQVFWLALCQPPSRLLHQWLVVDPDSSKYSPIGRIQLGGGLQLRG